MSLVSLINYDNSANFTFDSGLIEFIGTKARLKLQNAVFPAQTKTINFNSDGYMDVSAIETTSISKYLSFYITCTIAGATVTVPFYNAMVPNSVSVNITSITEISS